MDAKAILKKGIKKITPAYIAKLAVLTGISFVLYAFVKVKLPFMFPSFLDMQFSELPAILAGFSMGPVAGVLVIVFKCLLKLPMTNTAFVGELTDIVLGVAYVLPASIIYTLNKNKKTALWGLIIGSLSSTLIAIVLNRFVSVPAFVKLFCNNDFNGLVYACATLYPHINADNFYAIYLSAAVLPFNLLRLAVVSALTFFVYKHISKILHWEIKKKGAIAVEEKMNEEVSEKEDAFTDLQDAEKSLEAQANEQDEVEQGVQE